MAKTHRRNDQRLNAIRIFRFRDIARGRAIHQADAPPGNEAPPKNFRYLLGGSYQESDQMRTPELSTSDHAFSSSLPLSSFSLLSRIAAALAHLRQPVSYSSAPEQPLLPDDEIPGGAAPSCLPELRSHCLEHRGQDTSWGLALGGRDSCEARALADSSETALLGKGYSFCRAFGAICFCDRGRLRNRRFLERWSARLSNIAFPIRTSGLILASLDVSLSLATWDSSICASFPSAELYRSGQYGQKKGGERGAAALTFEGKPELALTPTLSFENPAER
jgi:hypothetical protein